jgi:hypothetical protein
MSTDYRLNDKVSAHDLFGERLKKCGVQEYMTPKADERSRCLTDGRDFLWVYLTEDGYISRLTNYVPNAPGTILDAIAEAFGTEIVSEHEPQYWGFDTKEKWHAAMPERANQECSKFYADVCAYLRGEPNDIQSWQDDIKANIAKALVEEDPALLDPNNKARLLSEMEAIYRRAEMDATHHFDAVVVTLSPEDLAVAQVIATHEDDLPQG